MLTLPEMRRREENVGDPELWEGGRKCLSKDTKFPLDRPEI